MNCEEEEREKERTDQANYNIVSAWTVRVKREREQAKNTLSQSMPGQGEKRERSCLQNKIINLYNYLLQLKS